MANLALNNNHSLSMYLIANSEADAGISYNLNGQSNKVT